MERGVEYDYLRSGCGDHLLACPERERVGMVMYRCQLCEVVYLLDSSGVVSVDAAGTLTALSAGTTAVTVKATKV